MNRGAGVRRRPRGAAAAAGGKDARDHAEDGGGDEEGRVVAEPTEVERDLLAKVVLEKGERSNKKVEKKG